MKAVQKFSREYLEQCRTMKPEQIVRFLEDFRVLHGRSPNVKEKSRLISIKMPDSLLAVFKAQCQIEKIPYQTQIKKLMVQWLNKSVRER